MHWYRKNLLARLEWKQTKTEITRKGLQEGNCKKVIVGNKLQKKNKLNETSKLQIYSCLTMK